MSTGQPDYTRQVAVTVIDTPDVINVQTAALTSIQVKGNDNKLTTTPDLPYISGRTASFENSNFISGQSPATHDVYTALSRNARMGYIVNDGSGDLQYQISNDGTNYGGTHTLKQNDVVKLQGLDISKIKITWVANCGYRILVV